MALTTIPVSKDTRDRLKRIASKGETYDKLLSRLIAAQHTGNVATVVSRDRADKTSVRVAVRAVKLKPLPPATHGQSSRRSAPGVRGMFSTRTRVPVNASSTADAMIAATGSEPDSPTPFTPSGFRGDGVSRWSISSGGISSLRGSA